MPPGPIGIYSIKSALERNFKNGLLVGLGASVMDIIYSFIAMMATSTVVGRYSSFTENYPVVDIIIRLAVVFILIAYGISQLRVKEKNPIVTESDQSPPQMTIARNVLKSFKGPFFIGVAMALVNAVHPTFLPALAAQAVAVQHNGWVDPQQKSQIAAFAIGFGTGNMAWMYVMLKIVVRFRHHMSDVFMVRLKKMVAGMFVVFGMYLGIRILTLTKWSNLFQ